MADLSALQNEIAAYSAKEISALIVDMKSDEIILQLESSKQMISASCIKLFVLLALLHKFSTLEAMENKWTITRDRLLECNGAPDSKVILAADLNDKGQIEKTLYELAFWMYTISDNVSTNACIDAAGGFDAVNEYIATYLPECKSTVLERYMLDDEAVAQGNNNYTSVQDMYIAHRLIVANSGEQLGLTDEAMSFLYKVLGQTRDLSRIMGRIFDYDSWTGKGGGLSAFALVHDAGVLSTHGNQYFIGFFTCHNDKSKPEVIDDMTQWGRIFYDSVIAEL